MKKFLPGFSFLLAFPLMANAFMLYDINYEPPTYVNGQNVGTGSGQTIHNDIAGFIGQALLIHDGGAMTYFSPSAYSSGVHRVSWDIAIPNGQSAGTILGISLGLESSTALWGSTVTSSHPSGNVITYGQGFPYPSGFPFDYDLSYAFDVLLDLDAHYYSFWVNGNLLEDHVAIADDAMLNSVRFNQDQIMGLQAGVDNFQWEVNPSIPEPGTVSLLLLGLPTLCFTHGILKPRKQKHSQ